MPGMGDTNAAGVAAGLWTSFTRIKLTLVVGICGGVPIGTGDRDEIFLGVIVFSTGVIQYDFGRQYPKELRRKDLVEDNLGRPPRKIRGLIAQLKTKMCREDLQTIALSYLEAVQTKMSEARCPGSEADLLFESSYLHKHHDFSTKVCQDCGAGPDDICEIASTKTCKDLNCDVAKLVNRAEIHGRRGRPADYNPSVHFGVIGSGKAVMKSGEHRDRIAKETGAIAFEMEGAGVWDFFPSIIIKGVCDYADSHKNKRWQKYAAATAASGMKAFLRQWTSNDDEQAQPQVLQYVPFHTKQAFIGRKKEIEILEDRLFRSDGHSKVAVFGLGGIGKSRLALEMVHRAREHYPTCSVFWVQATNFLTFNEHMLEIARVLTIPGIDENDADVTNLVKQHLSRSHAGKWLMVVDSADDEDLWGPKSTKEKKKRSDLIQSLPDSGCILITTRNRQIATYLAGRDTMELEELSRDEAVDTVKSILVDHDLSGRTAIISQLVERLACLPLAIVQATAYIKMKDTTIEDYLEMLEDTEDSVIDLLSEDVGDHERYSGRQNPMASTWFISFDDMRVRRPRAAEYLAFVSCLDERNIPLSILPKFASRRERIEVIGTLTGYSFLKKQNEELDNEVLYQMHHLVRLATRNWLKQQSRLLDSIRAALDLVSRNFPISTDVNTDECALYMPHAQILCDSEGTSDLEERYLLMEKMAIHFTEQNKFTRALDLHEEVVAWQEQYHGSQHLRTLAAFNSYGEALQAAGHWDQARTYFERAIEGQRSLLGQYNKLTLKSMNNLAALYQNIGYWEEAEDLSVKVINISKKVFGPEDPRVLKYTTSLVFTLFKSRRLHQALELCLKMKQTLVRTLSEEHPDTVASISQLGAIYQGLGRFKEAIETNEAVLEIRTRVFGREHTRTTISMVNLAVTYAMAGLLDEAEALGIEALEIRERNLGADHPTALNSMNNLAVILGEQGHIYKARLLIERCISLSAQRLGHDHPSTLQRRRYRARFSVS